MRGKRWVGSEEFRASNTDEDWGGYDGIFSTASRTIRCEPRLFGPSSLKV